VDVLREAGLEVAGMVSIFTYGFDVAEKAFAEKSVPHVPLTHYQSLLALAVEKGMISPEQQISLEQWRGDPANWGK
jgi:orotate phosphoribosyltransferase